MGKKVPRLRPYDQHREDITILCTLESKIISAEGVSCGTYDRDATNIHDRKALHSEDLHHIFSNLLLPAVFYHNLLHRLLPPAHLPGKHC